MHLCAVFGAAKGRTMEKLSIFESEARAVALVGAAAFDRVRATFGMTMTMTITTTTMRGGYG